MQQILRQTEFYHWIVVKLPLVLSSHRFNNFLLFRAPIPLRIWTLQVWLQPWIVLILSVFLIILKLVKVVERDLPDAGKQDFGAVTDLRYSTRQVATLFTCLQRLVYVDDLFKTLSEVTGPHLVFNVLVPHAWVHDSFTLHAARDLVQDVALTRVFRQIVSKFIFEDFKKHDLFLLHFILNVFIVFWVFRCVICCNMRWMWKLKFNLTDHYF